MFIATTAKRGYIFKPKGLSTTALFSLFRNMACNGSDYETKKKNKHPPESSAFVLQLPPKMIPSLAQRI